MSKSKGGPAALQPRRQKQQNRGKVSWLVRVIGAVVVAAIILLVVYLVRPRLLGIEHKRLVSPVESSAPPVATESHAPKGDWDLEQWEAEFDSSLWQGSIPEQLKNPPYLFTSGGALVKEVADLKAAGPARTYRVLMFDQSGEVQGVVAYDTASGAPLHQELTLEYVQTMAVAAMFSPALTCKTTGRALVLGLGAGSVASLLHETLRGLHVDVVEVSDDVRRAAQLHLGTPPEGPRFQLLMQDALTVFETLPAERRYDLIVFDAYMPGPAIPPTLATADYVQKMADHLSPRGVVVLNFCLPFYNLEEQYRLIQVYRASFKHLHFLEATPTSKIVVGYNFEPRRELAAVEAQLGAATAQCGWPATRRGLRYAARLPPEEGAWRAQWSRALHQEASEHFCATGDLPRRYCDWFTPRHELAKAVPVAYFGSLEQETALRKADNDWRRAIPIARKQGKLDTYN